MRPDEIFDFDEMDYAARTSNHDTQHLRQQEIIKTRQVAKAHAGVYQGTIASAATGGAAFIAPVYAGRQGDVAEAKLKIIQMELTKRGVPLHTTNNDDYAAVALSTLVGGEVGDLADAGLPATLPDSSIQAVAAGMVSEETGGSAADGLLDPKMPPSCTRRSLKKYHRLRCDACSRWFDTSFTEYLHCCQCSGDDYDLCDACATKSLPHAAGHMLCKMQPSRPKVHSSMRGGFGAKITCNGCGIRLKNVEFYSCEDCLGEYDICLNCYSRGLMCKHRGPLYRQTAGEPW